MGRFSTTAESQAGQLAGTPSGTTFNGYFAALVAGSAANFKLRRVAIGTRTNTAVVPTSQQWTLAIYRQTVRVVGTGFSTNTGTNLDPRGAATAITGLDFTTAATAGTTGPTIGALMRKYSLNTQSAFDIPYEMLEEFTCDQGTANGLAFLNIGNTLPAGHLITIEVEWEE